MAGIDLATATAKLNEYLNAETAVLANQRVVIDGHDFTRANLDSIQKGIEIWNQRVQQLSSTASNGGRTVRRIVPLS